MSEELCCLCNEIKRRLVTHHISYFPEQVMQVCDKCHANIHKYEYCLELCPPSYDYYAFNNCININYDLFKSPDGNKPFKEIIENIPKEGNISSFDLYDSVDNDYLKYEGMFLSFLYTLYKEEFIERHKFEGEIPKEHKLFVFIPLHYSWSRKEKAHKIVEALRTYDEELMCKSHCE